MGITERKEREKLELKQRILEAAQDIFVREGFEKASIRAIADKIEYSPATIYLHFKDKDELLFALHERGFMKMFEYMRGLDSITDAFEQLLKRGQMYLQFAIENPEMYDLMFINDAPMQALQKDGNNHWDCGMENFEGLKINIQRCMEQGYMHASDLNITAMTIWSYVHGLASLYIRGRFEKFPLQDPSLNIQSLMLLSLEQMLIFLRKKI